MATIQEVQAQLDSIRRDNAQRQLNWMRQKNENRKQALVRSEEKNGTRQGQGAAPAADTREGGPLARTSPEAASRFPGVEEVSRLKYGLETPKVPASLPRLWETRTALPAPAAPARSAQSYQEEMDGLDSALQELRRQHRRLDLQSTTMRIQATGTNNVSGTGPNPRVMSQVRDMQDQAGELAKEIARLEENRAGLQAERDRADEREFELKRRDPAFQAAVRGVLEAVPGKGVPRSRKPDHNEAFHATMYFQAKAQGNAALAEAAKNSANMALDRMSEGQRDRLVWYVSQGEYDQAADYLERIMPELNRRQAAQLERRMSDWAQEHPVLGAATNITSWPLNIPAYFDNARQAAENLITGEDRHSPYLTSYSGPKIGSGAAQGTQEAARSAAVQATGSEAVGDAAAFLVGTGLSIGQNATQIAALGPGSLAAMALSAAGGSTAEALDRGATPGQAFALGTASGAVEALTEKLPLDNLFRLAKTGGRQGVKGAAIELLKQMGTEATEEAISEIAGNIADAAVMGDMSELNDYIRQLQEAGMTRGDAERAAAFRFYWVNTGLAALGGGISGGVMGGGALALGQAGKNRAIDQAYQAMGEYGVFSPEAAAATREARYRLGPSTQELGNATRPVRLPGDGVTPPAAENAVQAPGGPVEAGAAEGNIPAPSQAQQGVQSPQNAAQRGAGQGSALDASNGGPHPSSGGTAPTVDAYEGRALTGGDLAAQFAFVENTMREAFEAGRLDEQGYRETVAAARQHYAEMTAAQGGAERVQGQSPASDAPGGTTPTADTYESRALTETETELAAQVRALRQDYAQGRISDGQFDAMMDSLETQAALEGMETSRFMELVDKLGPMGPAAEGGTVNAAGTAAEERLFDGDGGRLSGAGAGGKAGGLGAGRPQGPADAGGETGYRGDFGQHVRTEAVSSRELGLTSGTDERTVRLLPEDA